jgi:hypothetical protein
LEDKYNMTELKQILEQERKPEHNPDEQAGFTFSSAIKIFDPETKEVLVQKRGDD